MIPALTEEQKKKIYDWLIEARELAMDGESSDKKHAIFGKYKGRINNYLSAAGYDLTKERAEWQKRINAKKESSK
jgi:Spy/CpxP family protein refolding chaperone